MKKILSRNLVNDKLMCHEFYSENSLFGFMLYFVDDFAKKGCLVNLDKNGDAIGRGWVNLNELDELIEFLNEIKDDFKTHWYKPDEFGEI